MAASTDPYYDPYDFDIDTDPYPVWKRLRDEQPIYYNDKYDFWAISRFEDVEGALKNWQTLISGRSTILEMIKANWEPPIGLFLFEDPPLHDTHRGLLSPLHAPQDERDRAADPRRTSR